MVVTVEATERTKDIDRQLESLDGNFHTEEHFQGKQCQLSGR